jgi:hypothetical protein
MLDDSHMNPTSQKRYLNPFLFPGAWLVLFVAIILVGMTPWASRGHPSNGLIMSFYFLLATPVFGLAGCLHAVFSAGSERATVIALILDVCLFLAGGAFWLWWFVYLPSNQSGAADAGLRFSPFLAQWSGAADLFRWATCVSVRPFFQTLVPWLVAIVLPACAWAESPLGAWRRGPYEWDATGHPVSVWETVQFLTNGTFKITAVAKHSDGQEFTVPLTVSGKFTLVATNHIRLEVLGPKVLGSSNTVVTCSFVGDRLEVPDLLSGGRISTQVYYRVKR